MSGHDDTRTMPRSWQTRSCMFLIPLLVLLGLGLPRDVRAGITSHLMVTKTAGGVPFDQVDSVVHADASSWDAFVDIYRMADTLKNLVASVASGNWLGAAMSVWEAYEQIEAWQQHAAGYHWASDSKTVLISRDDARYDEVEITFRIDSSDDPLFRIEYLGPAGGSFEPGPVELLRLDDGEIKAEQQTVILHPRQAISGQYVLLFSAREDSCYRDCLGLVQSVRLVINCGMEPDRGDQQCNHQSRMQAWWQERIAAATLPPGYCDSHEPSQACKDHCCPNLVGGECWVTKEELWHAYQSCLSSCSNPHQAECAQQQAILDRLRAGQRGLEPPAEIDFDCCSGGIANGHPCALGSDCGSARCLAGPDGQRYCAAAGFLCAQPYADGADGGEFFDFDGSVYQCVGGQLIRLGLANGQPAAGGCAMHQGAGPDGQQYCMSIPADCAAPGHPGLEAGEEWFHEGRMLICQSDGSYRLNHQVCGKGRDGILCAGLGWNGTTATFLPPARLTRANGTHPWTGDGISPWPVIGYPDLNGDGRADICARRTTGIECFLARPDGTGFQEDSFATLVAYHKSNWLTDPSYFGTIQFPDIDGDGRDDICGRGYDGLWCSRSTGLGFGLSGGPGGKSILFSQFTTLQGWNETAYWATIQFPDVNGDGRDDVCGRSRAGIECYLARTDGFGFEEGRFATLAGFRTGNWLTDPSYWATIQFPDIDGDGRDDVCGRGGGGLYCFRSTGRGFGAGAGGTSFLYPHFTNAEGWNTNPSFWGTLRFADLDGDGREDVCGRSAAGMVCARSLGTNFAEPQTHPLFRDDLGWGSSPAYWSTIDLVDVDGDRHADLCARYNSGYGCHRFQPDSGTFDLSPETLGVATAFNDNAFNPTSPCVRWATVGLVGPIAGRARRVVARDLYPVIWPQGDAARCSLEDSMQQQQLE